jgi:hypothetical protein
LAFVQPHAAIALCGKTVYDLSMMWPL